jgi:broad specificity phosphatase PhoE
MTIASVAFAVALQRATDLVFVRHGETLANSTGKYESATIDAFSTRGQKEVDSLTQELLRQPRFDLILVSPSPRALRTIAPYLAATHQRATVWPLLYECCTGKHRNVAPASRVRFDGPIRIPPDIRGLFATMPSEQRYPNSPDYASGLAQVAAAVTEFNLEYTGRRILLVGHSGMGGHFLHSLTGKWIQVQNAKEIRVRLP